MNTWLLVGGPLVLVTAAVAALIHNGALFLGDVPGPDDQASTPSFSETAGLELENEPIEYRNGSESPTVRKLDGIKKFGNISLKWPIATGDLIFWNWVVDGVDERVEHDRQAETRVETKVETEFSSVNNERAAEGVEMIEIDPPVLVIPAR